MHELSLCEDIIQIVDKQSEQQMFLRVTLICLEIGQLSCVDINALQFCFDAIAKNTKADGCKLDIAVNPGEAKCTECLSEIEIENYFDACSSCGSFDLEIIGGDEMKIKRMEVV